MKAERKFIIGSILKNKYLILYCAVLIFGSVFGTMVLKILPENICMNLFAFISNDPKEFTEIFLNRFVFNFAALIIIYFCGFSIIGTITLPVIIFIEGFAYGFENGLKFLILGFDYTYNFAVLFFTSVIFAGFLTILMAESSVFFSKSIKNQIMNNSQEKPHYNAKKQTVKFVTFTVILTIISAFSAYISPIIQNRF